MWIRTQNKYILANANSFRIRKDSIDDWVYYASHTSECYKNSKDLIESEFSDLEVKENE